MAAPPLIMAHRGDSAHRPENTLASFASALEVGAVLVELDVQLTADGHVIVLHDPTVDRTTDGRGDARRMTLAEVRRLSAGYPDRFGDAYAGERVPTLAEVLTLVRERARTMIEIKGESVTDEEDGGIEARTVAEVRRLGVAERVALVSFESRALRRCRVLAPEVSRGHLFGRESVDEMLEASREADCQLVMPHKSQVGEELSRRVLAAGRRLATWVVDDPRELKALARFSLFGVGSNRPGVLLQAIENGLLDE